MTDTAYQRIYDAVRQIPRGSIKTYGEVAQAAGLFRGARLVGWALKALPAQNDVPWQRVVAQGGRISIRNPEHSQLEQARLLREEGVKVEETDQGYQIVS